MIMTEGRLQFDFGADATAMKFDDTKFYRKSFAERMPEGKGVDFIALTKDRLMLIEVKNCTGHESESIWRTDTNLEQHKKSILNKIPNCNEIKSSLEAKHCLFQMEDSFDIEIAKKVASTVACMAGAATYSKGIELDAQIYDCYWKQWEKLKKGTLTLNVILFLEGNFDSQTRSKKMIMRRIQNKLREHLKWLNGTMMVVDASTCTRYFQAFRL